MAQMIEFVVRWKNVVLMHLWSHTVDAQENPGGRVIAVEFEE